MDKDTFRELEFSAMMETHWKQVTIMLDKYGTRTKGQLGIIAKKSDGDHSWKAYLGVIAHPTDQLSDSVIITKESASLSKEQALGFFPQYKDLPYRK